MHMHDLTLLTDLYQLTMMNGYLKNGKDKDVAVFDLFFRRNNVITYSVAAGLEQAVEYIQNIRFTESDIKYLRSLGLFDEAFLEYLKDFRFTGDVYAVPEGTLVFPEEPLLTVRAPLCEAQLLETALLEEMQERKNVIISCGGGTALRQRNVEEMKKNGRVVLLTASPQTIYERVKDSDERPVLKGRKNVEGIAELMEQRREKYEAAADLVVQTDHKSVLQVCEELVQRLTEMEETNV